MATSGAKRQAAYMKRERKKLADALAEVKELKARVADLERERDRLAGFVGFVLKQEEWAGAGPKVAEVGTSDDADEVADAASSAIVVVNAPSPSRAPLAYGRTGAPIPPWLLPAP